MKLSIIISYYKNPRALQLILQALSLNTSQDFEVVISEDDNNEETTELLKELRKKYAFSILHVHQDQDKGFRKNKMLNKSLRISNYDNLVFLDGDCIPQRKFVKSYLKKIKEGHYFCGRRVMLSANISEKLYKTTSITSLHIRKILFSKSKKKKEAFYTPYLDFNIKKRGILGCNWGIKKSHLLDINGFDEDYELPSVGEDTDVEWRLQKLGLTPKSMKNRAIVYHLHHDHSYSKENWQANMAMMKKKQDDNLYICLNGLDKLQP